uniref:Uncharacterized protein n=1 Tax=Aegilops tauschii TaxID=37682 RepID=N1R221_AEGTA
MEIKVSSRWTSPPAAACLLHRSSPPPSRSPLGVAPDPPGEARSTGRSSPWRFPLRAGDGVRFSSPNVAKGILWCGVMTVDRLRWGNKMLRKRIQPGDTEAKGEVPAAIPDLAAAIPDPK